MATVPERRVDLVEDAIKIAAPVRGDDWIEASQLLNWCAGRGTMVVPIHSPLAQITDATTFLYRVRPPIRTTYLAVSVVLTSPSVSKCEITAQMTSPSGVISTTVEVDVSPSQDPRTSTFIIKSPSLYDDARTIGLVFAAPLGTVTFHSLGIEALPRGVLVNDDDIGVVRGRYMARQPIAQPSVGELAGSMYFNRLWLDARRAGFFHYSWGTHRAFWVTSTSWQPLFRGPIPILQRKFAGSTESAARLVVHARSQPSTIDGEVRVTNKAGEWIVPISGDTGGAFTTREPDTGPTIVVDAEDNETAKGWQGGTPDWHTFEARLLEPGEPGERVDIASISMF